jgi:hypothetical protein
MKVTSVEKKEYEEVMIDGVKYRRYDSNEWEHFGDHIFYYKNLEAAYQKFINPPFKITNDPEGVTLTIKRYPPIYLMSHYPVGLKEELEQALNSLMEK